VVNRINILTKSPWESVVGYSRAVHLGPFVFVSGTTATDEKGIIVGLNDPYTQTVQSLKNIEAALKAAGASVKDVVRTRIYAKNIDDWEKIGKAHAEMFSDIHPACTMVEVSRLIAPEILVEIEADAFISESRAYD
jgi:enamine deaminase RidA (YjgF/YER057c/UK114 family)